MSDPAINEYVLQTCVHYGWISEEQSESVQFAISQIPQASALDYLVEQQMLSQENADWLNSTLQGGEEQGTEGGEVPEVAVTHELPKFEHINDYLMYGVEQGASDIHLGPDAPPLLRLSGKLCPIYEGVPLFTKEETEKLSRQFLTEKQAKVVEEKGSFDFCYELKGTGRFRSSVVRQRRGWESVFRIINSRVRTMQELNLPPVLYDIVKYHNGLILVTGAVGSGKSTTLAAMIEQINYERSDHIITLEDPVEYVYTPATCQISQREVHTHTDSFGTALRASLREDPDVIMVGEMRDLETISLAITASETGHLVLGTLHTSTAARTLDRLLDVFPIEQQSQIRTMVSESIRGIVCQQLVPRADGNGRALAMEIMTNTPAVGNLIREAKTFMLPGVMQTGKKQGMKLMDDSLMELLEAGTITPQEAHARAENKKIFEHHLRGGY